ncbi:MAG: choice-of-anchor B family protein [Bacteroidetes bacterium]|nr:MAG: choice-of-anchor B family protein [Bacteroidota bacterium]
MKRTFACICFLGLFQCLWGQPAQNMSLHSRWADDTLPASGSIRYNEVWGYVDCQGNEYALLGSAGFMHFIEIVTPDSLREVGRFAGGNVTVWRDPKTYRDHAYSVCDGCQEGMMVFDLSALPDSVSKVYQSNEIFQGCHNIFIDEPNGKLYAIGTNTQHDGVIIFDLTQNPDTPAVWARHSLPGGYIHDMYVRDNIGFAASGNNGLWVYDFSDPDTAIVLGNLTQYPQKGYNHSNWLSDDGNYLVFADETHNRSLKMADVSDLSDIQVLDLFRSKLLAPADTGSIAHNPFIRDHYVIVSYYHDGVSVFDFSDPANVTQVAWFDTEPENTNYNGYQGCWGVYPFLPSGLILASDIKNGLFVLSADSIEFDPIVPVTTPDATITVGGDTHICEGESVTLAAPTGAETYSWYLNGELIGQGTPKWDATDPGFYTVVVKNGHCSAESMPVQVLVKPFPDATISASDLQICAGDTATLSLNAPAENYAWYFADSLIAEGISTIQVTAPGEYYATAQNGDCLAESEPVTLGVTPVPDSEIHLGGKPDLCAGQSVWLSSAGDAAHYAWFRDGLSIAAGDFPEIEVTEAGMYYFEAQNGDCVATSDPVQITVTPVPDATLSADGDPFYCTGDQPAVTLTVAGPADEIQWFMNGDGLADAHDTTFAPDTAGTYFSTLTNFTPNGSVCADTSDAFVVFEVPRPAVEIMAPDTIFCLGDQMTLEASPGYAAYTWYRDQMPLAASGQSIDIADGGTYVVEAFNGICWGTSGALTITAHVPTVPVIQVAGNTLSTTTGIAWQWLLDGQPIPGAVDAVWEATVSGFYTVEVMDEVGCLAVSAPVQVIVSGVAETTAPDGVELFPNPATDQVFVHFESVEISDYQLVIGGVDGVVRLEKILRPASGDTFKFDLSNWPAGTYWVRISTDQTTGTLKFIKH